MSKNIGIYRHVFNVPDQLVEQPEERDQEIGYILNELWHITKKINYYDLIPAGTPGQIVLEIKFVPMDRI